MRKSVTWIRDCKSLQGIKSYIARSMTRARTSASVEYRNTRKPRGVAIVVNGAIQARGVSLPSGGFRLFWLDLVRSSA